MTNHVEEIVFAPQTHKQRIEFASDYQVLGTNKNARPLLAVLKQPARTNSSNKKTTKPAATGFNPRALLQRYLGSERFQYLFGKSIQSLFGSPRSVSITEVRIQGQRVDALLQSSSNPGWFGKTRKAVQNHIGWVSFLAATAFGSARVWDPQLLYPNRLGHGLFSKRTPQAELKLKYKQQNTRMEGMAMFMAAFMATQFVGWSRMSMHKKIVVLQQQLVALMQQRNSLAIETPHQRQMLSGVLTKMETIINYILSLYSKHGIVARVSALPVQKKSANSA